MHPTMGLLRPQYAGHPLTRGCRLWPGAHSKSSVQRVLRQGSAATPGRRRVVAHNMVSKLANRGGSRSPRLLQDIITGRRLLVGSDGCFVGVRPHIAVAIEVHLPARVL